MTEIKRRTAMFNRRASVSHPDLALDAASQARLADIMIDSVQPDPGNPRRHYDQAALDALAASLTANGLLQPITVRPGEDGVYLIITGERRWRAARLAGFASIKAIIRPNLADASTLLLAQIAENENREGLNTLDLVDGVRRLISYGLNQTSIAARLGFDRTRVVRIAALAELPVELQPLLSIMGVDPLYEL